VLGARRADALLFKQLATLRTDAPLFRKVSEIRWKGPTPEFAALAQRIGADRVLARCQRLAETR
jgi:hypothetical protein